MVCCCSPHFTGVFLPEAARPDVPSVNAVNDLVAAAGGDINKELRFSVTWDCPKDLDSYSYVKHGDGETVRFTYSNKTARYQSGGADFEVLLDVDDLNGNADGQPAVENRTFDGLPATGLTKVVFALHDYSGANKEALRAEPGSRNDNIGVPYDCDAFVVIEHRNIPAGEAPLSHYALIKMPNIGGQEKKEETGVVATAYKCNGEYVFVLGGEYEVTVDTEDDRKEMRRPEIVKSHGIRWAEAPPVCG